MNFAWQRWRQRYVRVVRTWPWLHDASRRLSRLFERSDVYCLLVHFNKIMRNRVNFLQIGANDGMLNDPIREFIVFNSWWSGTLVEPLPSQYERLRENYKTVRRHERLRFIHSAVGAEEGFLSLWHVDPAHNDVRDYVTAMASFDKRHFPRNLGPEFPVDHLISTKVPCLSIKNLVDHLHYDLDLLVLDVEGMEYDILTHFPFCRMIPKLCLFESYHLPSPLKASLLKHLDSAGFPYVANFGKDSAVVSEAFAPSMLATCPKNLASRFERIA